MLLPGLFLKKIMSIYKRLFEELSTFLIREENFFKGQKLFAVTAYESKTVIV
jgi:hypothetical protein